MFVSYAFSLLFLCLSTQTHFFFSSESLGECHVQKVGARYMLTGNVSESSRVHCISLVTQKANTSCHCEKEERGMSACKSQGQVAPAPARSACGAKPPLLPGQHPPHSPVGWESLSEATTPGSTPTQLPVGHCRPHRPFFCLPIPGYTEQGSAVVKVNKITGEV